MQKVQNLILPINSRGVRKKEVHRYARKKPAFPLIRILDLIRYAGGTERNQGKMAIEGRGWV